MCVGGIASKSKRLMNYLSDNSKTFQRQVLLFLQHITNTRVLATVRKSKTCPARWVGMIPDDNSQAYWYNHPSLMTPAIVTGYPDDNPVSYFSVSNKGSQPGVRVPPLVRENRPDISHISLRSPNPKKKEHEYIFMLKNVGLLTLHISMSCPKRYIYSSSQYLTASDRDFLSKVIQKVLGRLVSGTRLTKVGKTRCTCTFSFRLGK